MAKTEIVLTLTATSGGARRMRLAFLAEVVLTMGFLR